MKNEIVEVKRGKVYCTSLMFAEKMEMLHGNVLRDIRELISHNSVQISEFSEEEFVNGRNRKYKMFVMTKKGFFSLIMNTNVTPKRKEKLYKIQNNFIDAFEKMEKLLLKQQTNAKNVEWLKHRELGKNTRLELTDTIKDFVDYATSQGSKSAKMYYMNITKMEYKALNFIQLSKPKLRETLDTLELYQLLLAEEICKKSIKRSMDEGLHYKEIYIIAKQDIEKYANVILIK